MAIGINTDDTEWYPKETTDKKANKNMGILDKIRSNSTIKES